MDAYANDRGPEREMNVPSDLQMLEMVIVQNTVIYPLAGRTLSIDRLKCITIPGDTWKIAEITMWIQIKRPAVFT